MTLAIAHRGDPYGHRENTIPAVLAAIEQGADLVEIDVSLTRDGTVILLHDATLNRLWEHDRAVAELTADEVAAVGRGLRYQIPTFDRVLALSSAAGRALMVDLTVPEVASRAAAIVAEQDGLAQHVFAGHIDGLLEIRRRWPQARIALSWNRFEPPSRQLLAQVRPEFFNPNCWLVNQELLDRMHADGYQVSTWTVDSPSNMARLIEMGVDAIITNRLRHLLAVRAHRSDNLVYPARPARPEQETIA
jgi:glycerophosphoryl diester phosphodiesterase